MDSNSGRLYPSLAAARLDGVVSPVEITGTPEAVERISAAVSAKYLAERKARNKAAKQSRRANR